jgi:hypothetical protein
VEDIKPSENFINLIKEKQQDVNFMPEYILVRSFENVNLINEELSLDCTNLELEYGISNMEEYKLGFEQILKGLDENKIYKLLFRWKSLGSNHFGESSVEFNTSPSFFIYKGIDIDVLLYKYSTLFNVFENRYGFGGVISLDVFIKE